AGKPCVLVDGFRAISVSGARVAGAPGDTRDVVYHIDGERPPVTPRPAARPPLPLEQLRSAAHRALEQVISVRGRDKLEEAIASADDLTAVQVARGWRKMGAQDGATFRAASRGFAE